MNENVGLLAMPQFPVQVLKAVVGVKKKELKKLLLLLMKE